MKCLFIIFALFFVVLSNIGATATSEQYMNAGDTLSQKGDLETAAKYFAAAAQVDPTNWHAFQSLGTCRYKLGQYPEALEAYEKVLALNPDPKIEKFVSALHAKLDQGGMSGSMAVAKSIYPDQAMLSDFYAAKTAEEKNRDGLKLYSQTHTLTNEEMYVANWGAPPSEFREPHFDIEWGLWYMDLGVNLDPTTNIGFEILDVPLTESYYDYNYNSSNYYDETENITYTSGNFIYFEPRIKFYSSPSGLSTYQGFGFIYMGYKQGADPYDTEDIPTTFDLFAASYLFGFRTLPKDGWTMELGFQMGLAVIIINSELYNYNETYVGGTYGYTYTPTQVTTTVPFPFIIPEWRFGYTF